MLQKLTIRQKKLAEYLLIVAGTAVIAVSLQFFLDPDGMVPGGFTGIAIIVKELTKGIVPDGVPLWVTNLILNVPMVPIVLKINGWDFAKRTVAGSLLLFFLLSVIPYVQLMEEPDLFLTSVFGGVSMGIGVGLVFLGKGTTGGTDMCGAILHHFFPYISLPKLMQLLDDAGAVLFLPVPACLQEFIASQIVLIDAFFSQLVDYLHLGCDCCVVGTRLPQRLVALHSLVTGQDVLHGVIQCMTHMQLSGNVRRWHNDGKGLLALSLSALSICVEVLVIQPFLIQLFLNGRRIVILFQFFHDHFLSLCLNV